MPQYFRQDSNGNFRPVRSPRRRRREKYPKRGEKGRKTQSTQQDEPIDSTPISSSVHPYKRWNNSGLGVIDDIKNVPKDWDWTDDDIDEDDITANIERCKQRIEDGIMPQWWKQKLTYLTEDAQAVQNVIDSEPEGLSIEVITRLKTLEIIHKALAEQGDEYKQSANIEAIMKHYRSQGSDNLSWKNGYVTYWANGVLLSDEMEILNWERFRELSNAHVESCKTETDHDPTTGIWVEGGSNPGPDSKLVRWADSRIVLPPDGTFGRHIRYRLAYRIPGSDRHVSYRVQDDTGASRSNIFRDDLERLVYLGGRKPRFLCMSVYETANGEITCPTLELECCMVELNGDELTPWVTTEVSIENVRRPAGVSRMGGPFVREMLYTATVPDGRSELYISRTKRSLMRNPFPTVDVSQADVPVKVVPVAGQTPGREWRNLLRVTNALS